MQVNLCNNVSSIRFNVFVKAVRCLINHLITMEFGDKYNILKVCRTCLSEKVNMQSIHEASLKDMLKSCTRIQIEKGDGLPEQMCKQCIVQVNKSYKFKQLCEKSDDKLRLYIKNKTQSKTNPGSVNADIEEISEHSTSSVYSIEDDVTICNQNIELCENKSSKLKTNDTADTLCTNEPTNESFTCAICFQTFTMRRQYSQHLRTHWNLGCYECPVCKQKCGLPSLLARHMKSHEETDKTYKCVHCDRTCLGQVNLNRHIKEEHSEHEEKHTCNICGKSFVESSLLTVHMRQHSPLSCEVCGKSFMLPISLRKHLKVHFGKYGHKCEHCAKTFSNNYQLTIHLRTHTGEKPFMCNVCGKTTSTHASLQTHMRVHSGEKPYGCELCDQAFATHGQLRLHVRRHTGERPYSCNVCSKKFIQKYDLNVHSRYHTGKRPYECSVCTKRFVTGSHLKVHLRTHTGERPYKCSECDKSFSVQQSLKDHARTHTGQRPFVCVSCGANFTQLGSLNTHMKTHNK